MEKHIFRLALAGYGTWSFEMPAILAQQLTGEDPERLKTPLKARELRVAEKGFNFVIEGEEGRPDLEMIYEPVGFPLFLEEMSQLGISNEAILAYGSKTAGAHKLNVVFRDWCDAKIATDFESAIKANKLTFEEARDIRKQAFDVPRFAAFFKERWLSGTMPKARKGKRRAYSQNVRELYALASRIYRQTPGISFEAACFEATAKRPDLIPAGWSKEPDDNLKREAARYWDKSPYSLLSYRQDRDG